MDDADRADRWWGTLTAREKVGYWRWLDRASEPDPRLPGEHPFPGMPPHLKRRGPDGRFQAG